MNSLVIDLQERAKDQAVPVSSLLREALVVSKKLNIKDFTKWISQELYGRYEYFRDIPLYRQVECDLVYKNPFSGNYSSLNLDSYLENDLSIEQYYEEMFPVLDFSVIRIEHFKTKPLYLNIDHDFQRYLRSLTKIESKFELEVNTDQPDKILDYIRTIVLEWAVSLESEKVLGEKEEEFSAEDREKAQAVSSTVIYNMFGNNNTFQHEPVNSHQNVINNVQKEEIEKIVENIKRYTVSIGDDEIDHSDLNNRITELESKIETEDYSSIKSAAVSVRTVLESASGNVIAEGLISLISQFITR